MKSLFGRKKPQAQENPYAQQQAAQEEYDRMTPYQRARADLANNNQRSNIPGGLPSGPGPRRDYNASPAQSTRSFGGSTYVESPNQSYGPNRYGSNQGYGANRYDSNSTAFSSNQSAPSARPSGYGGFEPSEPADTSELYGDARPSDGPNRYARQPQQPQESANRYAPGGPASGRQEEEDNEYDDTELTPEQREEKEFRNVKKQQMDVRRDILASQGRSLGMLDQMIETGGRTLATVSQQGERLNRVDQSLNVSAAHARHAESKTKELQTLNRSMFAVHVENPFTKKKNEALREKAFIEQDRAERGEREAVRSQQYLNNQRNEETFRKIEAMKAKRNKYTHSDVSDEEEGDDDETYKAKVEESGNYEEMANKLGIVKYMAMEVGDRVQEQNRTIDNIGDKTDGVTDHVVKNSAKLRTFK